MQIKAIGIKDFLGLESLLLELTAPINIFVGENEAGKSSLRDAVLWALSGQARGLKTHEQQAALIRNGAKAAEVQIAFADGRKLARRKTPKSPATVTGEVPDCPLPPGVLADPFEFLAWPEDKRRELMFQLIPGLNPSGEEIFKRLRSESPFCDLTEERLRESAMDLIESAAKQGFPAAHTEAVSRRREAKRVRDSFSQAAEPSQKISIGGRDYILPDVDREAVVKGIQELQAERDAIIKARGSQEAAVKRIAAIEGELSSLKETAPQQPPREGAVAEWQEEVNGLKTKQRDLEASLNAFKAPEVFPAVCPAILAEQIPCPKAGECVGQVNPAKMIELEEDLSACREALAAAEEKLKETSEREAAYKSHTERTARLEKELADLKAQTGQEGEKDGEADTAALEQRLENGHKLLGEVQKFWDAKNAFDMARERLEQIEQEIALYDSLAKALAPDGLPSKLIAESLGPVNELLALAAARLFPNRDLYLNEELGIELAGSPFITLSKSACFRVGVAFQYALARLSGSRLLMIDEADILDPENRTALIGFLLEIREAFDTVMVFATAPEAQPSPVPEIQVWQMQGGKATALKTKQAA